MREKDGIGFLLEVSEPKHVFVIDRKPFSFSNGWEGLVEDVDEILFQLERDGNCKVDEMILFLYSFFIDQEKNEIKKQYLEKIKNIVKELELKALGYIDHHEAIAMYLAYHEKTPLTALIVEVEGMHLSVFTYKAGELIFSRTVDVVHSLIWDLETILDEMKKKHLLPPRIIIYDTQKVEHEAKEILHHEWKGDLFVQLPKVEVLTEGVLEKALIHAFSGRLAGGEKQEEESVRTKDEKDREEVLGFVIGEDIRYKEVKEEEKVASVSTDQRNEPSNRFLPLIAVLKSINPLRFFKNIHVPFTSMKQFKLRKLAVLIFLILIVAAGAFSSLYFFHKAALTVYSEAKTVEKSLEIETDTRAPSSTALFIEKIEQTIQATEKMATTGKKTIGEKSRGEVTLYNLSTEERIFKKNTLLKTNNIVFFLDEEIKVASASESITSEGNVLTVTGKAKGRVSAQEIGKEGNIDKSVKLQVEDIALAVFFALPVSSFTGGSKQDVQTVSKEDLEKLKKKVSDTIKTEGSKKLGEKDTDTRTIDQLTKITIKDEEYSKELGEETKEISLTASGSLTMYTYKEEDMKKTIVGLSDQFVDDTYALLPQNVNYVISSVEEDPKIRFKTDITAKTILKVDEQKIKKTIVGKAVDDVESELKDLYAFDEYDIKITTPVPFLQKRLPFFPKNIQIRSTVR